MGQPSLDAELFESGIHTENSDVRAHVSVVNKAVYVFPTKNGIAAVERTKPELRSAGQFGVVGRTASGWPTAISAIEDMRRVGFPGYAGWDEFTEDASTSAKGAAAVRCVIEVMRRGRFPFWLDAWEDQRENVQVKGTDILVFCKKKVQVKCDWTCGEKPLGTGNVYLQKAERNPLRRF